MPGDKAVPVRGRDGWVLGECAKKEGTISVFPPNLFFNVISFYPEKGLASLDLSNSVPEAAASVPRDGLGCLRLWPSGRIRGSECSEEGKAVCQHVCCENI